MRSPFKMLLLALAVCFAATALSFAGAYPETPEKVMEAYLTAAMKGDSAAAYQFLSKEMKSGLSQADFDKQLAVFRGSKEGVLEKAKAENMSEAETKFLTEFFMAFVARVSFKEITNVKIEGDKASLTAVLLMPNPDSSTPELTALKESIEKIMSGATIDDATLVDQCRKGINSAQMIDDPQQIDLVKEDGQWRINDQDALFAL